MKFMQGFKCSFFVLKFPRKLFFQSLTTAISYVRTYLFDLDFNRGDQNLYTVDAAFYGNLSHFINHRSAPKLSSISLNL